MKRYIIAIFGTRMLVITPLIGMAFIQWFVREFLDPKTEIYGMYMLLAFVSVGMFIINGFLWASAITGKKLKDLTKF